MPRTLTDWKDSLVNKNHITRTKQTYSGPSSSRVSRMWLIFVSTSEESIASRASDDTSRNSGRPSILGKLIGIDLEAWLYEVEGRVASSISTSEGVGTAVTVKRTQAAVFDLFVFRLLACSMAYLDVSLLRARRRREVSWIELWR